MAKTATLTSARSTAPASQASLCLTLTITTLPPWWACRSGRISIADQQTRCFRASAEITAASSSRACCDPQSLDGALLCKALQSLAAHSHDDAPVFGHAPLSFGWPRRPTLLTSSLLHPHCSHRRPTPIPKGTSSAAFTPTVLVSPSSMAPSSPTAPPFSCRPTQTTASSLSISMRILMTTTG